MIKICFSFLFIFILINFQVEAKSSCNNECLTKSYCISSDGSGVCSKNNLVTVQFKALSVFGKYDYLQVTLNGYSVASDDEKTIKVSLKSPRDIENIFTCYKSSLGSTYARFDRSTYGIITGSSIYLDGVLSCAWTFNYYDDFWPSNVDILKDSSQSITLYHDSQKVLVAQNSSQLPIYRAQYLKCCNDVHDNDAFLLTFDQTEKEIRYRIYYWNMRIKELDVILTRKDGIKLLFKCIPDSHVEGYIINATERVSISQQLIEPAMIHAEICSWATPFVLGNSRISIDASTSVFDLQVKLDNDIVYTEKDVVLKNTSHFIKLSFIVIAFAVLFQISLIC